MYAIVCGNAVYGMGKTKELAFEDSLNWVDFDSTSVSWDMIKDPDISGFHISYRVDESDHKNYYYVRIAKKLANFVEDHGGDVIWECKILNGDVYIYSEVPRLVELPRDFDWSASIV